VKEHQQEDQGDEALRGRPGRRSVKDRTEAVLALLSGKKSVDALAEQFGVSAGTIEPWRAAAIAGGRLLGTMEHFVDADKLFGFDSFPLLENLEDDQPQVTRILVFARKF
jgi:transposase-like protein